MALLTLVVVVGVVFFAASLRFLTDGVLAGDGSGQRALLSFLGKQTSHHSSTPFAIADRVLPGVTMSFRSWVLGHQKRPELPLNQACVEPRSGAGKPKGERTGHESHSPTTTKGGSAGRGLQGTPHFTRLITDPNSPGIPRRDLERNSGSSFCTANCATVVLVVTPPKSECLSLQLQRDHESLGGLNPLLSRSHTIILMAFELHAGCSG
jgi:hypothetical protein